MPRNSNQTKPVQAKKAKPNPKIGALATVAKPDSTIDDLVLALNAALASARAKVTSSDFNEAIIVMDHALSAYLTIGGRLTKESRETREAFHKSARPLYEDLMGLKEQVLLTIEAEAQRAAEAEAQRAAEVEAQRAAEAEAQRAAEVEAGRLEKFKSIIEGCISGFDHKLPNATDLSTQREREAAEAGKSLVATLTTKTDQLNDFNGISDFKKALKAECDAAQRGPLAKEPSLFKAFINMIKDIFNVILKYTVGLVSSAQPTFFQPAKTDLQRNVDELAKELSAVEIPTFQS